MCTEKRISLRYLPIFYEDVIKAIDYISHNLKNTKAADDLVALIKQRVEERLPFADSFHSFKSRKERKYEYYKIKVRNYDIYYVIINDNDKMVMEVRRFLHNSMDIAKLI